MGKKSLNDPTRNSFANLIGFVATGVDVAMDEDEEEAQAAAIAAAAGEDGHTKKKKDKKKKKNEEEVVETGGEEEKKKKKEKKKEKKKKDKKKKKKNKKEGGDDGGGDSDLELDSDDDLSLGSVPMSSSSSSGDEEEEEDEVNNNNKVAGILSRQVSKRASVADGLKAFQTELGNSNAPIPTTTTAASTAKTNKQRRHTYGAALKGFQIDVTALQQDANDSEGVSGLAKNLPNLSLASIRQKSARNKKLTEE